MRQQYGAMCLAAAATLAACGGGGDGDDGGSGAVPLAAKGDVLREISVVGGIASLFQFGSGIPVPVEAAAKSASARRHWAAAPRRTRSIGKAATTEPCDSGSVVVDTGSRTETFDYFGDLALAVDYEVYDYRDCYIDYGDETFEDSDFDDGRVEHGDSDLSGGYVYGYSEFGSGSTPELYRLHYEPDGEDPYIDEIQSLGRLEYRTSSSRFELRMIYELREEVDDQGQRYTLDLDLGAGSSAFAMAETTESVEIDGPYRYASSACDGGSASVTTLEALRFDEAGSLEGGRVRLDAGDASVVVEFNADGSASYQFGSGGAGVLSSGEVAQALYEPDC